MIFSTKTINYVYAHNCLKIKRNIGKKGEKICFLPILYNCGITLDEQAQLCARAKHGSSKVNYS